MVVWPELAHVLARVIAPVRGDKKHVLLVARYDYLKRIIRAPLPYLFQHQRGPNSQVLTHNLVKDMLDQALMRAGVTSSVGTLLRYTSHDFRRILATEAVSGGLPVRIGAKLLGHRDRAGNSVRVITPGPRRQRGP